ncbi:MAG: glycosyltransferase involved in cell wall biosynthesis [Phenylobacterium sp.]|jgi:glycosyltransferase involved in cell wall biosynthesis
MNLLIVLPGGVHPSGDIEVIPALLQLCRALNQHHRVCIVALHQHQQLTEYRLFDCQVISLAMVKTSNLVTSCFTVVKRLKHYGFKPDLVHSFWLGKTTLLGAMLSKKYQLPLLASVAGGEPVNMPEIGYGGSLSFVGRCFNSLSIKLADGVSCGSGFIQSMTQQRWAITPQLIPLGIDTSFWQPKDVGETTAGPWQLLQLASINAVKDPWLLLDIVAHLHRVDFDFHLNWVGEDTLGGAIQKQAAKMGLTGRISFHGFKTQQQLKPMLAQQHFVIQSSRHESQGVAMAEACSQGVCPVGTDVGWLSDLAMGLSGAREKLALTIAEQIIALAADFQGRKGRVDKVQKWIQANDLSVTVARFNARYLLLV